MTTPTPITGKKAKELDRELIYQHYRGETTKTLIKNRLLRSVYGALSLKNFLLSTISSKIAFQSLEILNYNNTRMGRVTVLMRQANSKADKIRRWADAINNERVKPDTPQILKNMVFIEKPDVDDILRFG